MGKTHEALKQAEKELQEQIIESPVVPQQSRLPAPYRPPMKPTDTSPYDELRTKILTLFKNPPVKTMLFTGLSNGVDTSTTAVGFATSMSKVSDYSVLLVDVNMRAPSLHQVFNINHTLGLSDLLNQEIKIASLFKKVGSGNLFVLTCGGKHSNASTLFETQRFDQFLNVAREKFDFVIMDAPPVLASPEARVIGKKVDGVIMVIDSGKVRRQVAMKAKNELEQAGSRMLGIVLQGRKFYIPKWLYKRI